MPQALIARALAAAALTASSGQLDINENGTYSTTVQLGSKPVRVALDSTRFGLWVSCRVFEDDQCDVGVSGYPQYPYTSLEYGTRRLASVTIAGQVFTDFTVYVAYDPLRVEDADVQGYLGLDSQTLPVMPTLGEGANVTTVALQLGKSSAESVLAFNTIDQAQLDQRGLGTKTTVKAQVSCFRLPVARSNTTVDDCTFSAITRGSSSYQAEFDSTSRIIELEPSALRAFEARYLDKCAKLRNPKVVTSRADILGYTCNATMKLPRLMLQMSAWEFYLDPVDYTQPANATVEGVAQVEVLIGGVMALTAFSNPWVLGTPFMRKFPVMFNATEPYATQYYNLFCKENTTCKSVPERAVKNSYGGGGGEGGGGGGGGGGVDVSARRKRNKLIWTIGLSVGGVALLAIFGWICKCCLGTKSDEEDDLQSDPKAAAAAAAADVDASVELTVPLTVGSVESSPKNEFKGTSKAAKVNDKRRAARRDSSSSEDEDESGGSSDYDSESSEERRRDRRRRRRRRRERRKLREEREKVNESATSEIPDHYVAAPGTPRAGHQGA